MSSAEQSRKGHDVRMNVKVSRRDFPVLTDEIARLPKGPRRTNRLAHLATLGLLWERAVANSEAMPRDANVPLGLGPAGLEAAPQGYRNRLDASFVAALLHEDAES